MSEREMLETQRRADLIVAKIRELIALESQILAATETGNPDGNLALKDLEARLKTRVEELGTIVDELKWATPCFRAFNSEERKDFENVIAALATGDDPESADRLAAEIFARLRANIEQSFGA